MCAVFGRHMDVPSENSRPACGPHGFIVGRDVRVCFFGYFLCTSKESDSRVSAALNSEAGQRFCLEFEVKDKIKMDPSVRWDDEPRAFASGLRSCPSIPVRRGKQARSYPEGAAHRDLRRFRRRRKRLTKIPGLLADPTASSWGATSGCVSLVTFFAQAKKVTRALARLSTSKLVNAFDF